jgi:2-amino-4-hydroxy-6-hydroxymethyldihydropteridine diphosphokinase
MKRAWLDLGSNLQPQSSLRAALELLEQCFQVNGRSQAYQSAPVGFADQPDFFNLCVEIQTELSPAELRARFRALEDRLGRVRTENKYGPRTIDIDLVLHEDGYVHPQVATQFFVLVPLLELCPEGLPGVPLKDYLKRLGEPDLKQVSL